jgi:hypothetical protein
VFENGGGTLDFRRSAARLDVLNVNPEGFFVWRLLLPPRTAIGKLRIFDGGSCADCVFSEGLREAAARARVGDASVSAKGIDGAIGFAKDRGAFALRGRVVEAEVGRARGH